MHSSSGFSFIEVLIALLIISISIMATSFCLLKQQSMANQIEKDVIKILLAHVNSDPVK